MEPFPGASYPFANGHVARLASWEDLSPVAHGQSLFDRPWTAASGRDGLSFYDATEEYMRNTWAMDNLPSMNITDSTGGITRVFQWPRTGTWHTIDAFDIDHATPAVQYAEQLGARNVAEANIAYNDIGNLRLMPSAANRSGYFNEGLRNREPPEGWVTEKFGFDSTAARPMSQPVNRSEAMYEKPWSLENDGRKSLSFDDDIRSNWFESRLHDTYVGDAEIDGQTVPLFECEATGQLVTRDALDIDHKLPIDGILRRVRPTNKGDALDLYNDRTNLRLVSRSANSSGDWELNDDGTFIDGRKRGRRGANDLEDEEQRGEFDDFIEPGGDPAPRADMDEIRGMLGRRLNASSFADAPASDAPVNNLGTFGRGAKRAASEPGSSKRLRSSADVADDARPADAARGANVAADADTAPTAATSASASDATVGTSAVAEGAADASLAADAGEILEVGALLLL